MASITFGVTLVKNELQNHKLTSLGMPCLLQGTLSDADFSSSMQAKVAHKTIERNGSNSLSSSSFSSYESKVVEGIFVS